jgi:opacity protein-like surface antigen
MQSRSIAVFVKLGIALALAGGAAAAQADSISDHLSVELFAGENVGMPGSFRADRLPVTGGNPDNRVYGEFDFDSAYDHRYTGGAELDYTVNQRLSAFARAAYSRFDGQSHEIGALFTDSGDTPITARFADNTMRQIDVGGRYTFAPGAMLRPFLGAGVGLAELSATRANIDNVAGGGTLDVDLGRANTVFTERLETGLQYSPMRNLDLRLTAAASHFGKQKPSVDPNLRELGIETTHGEVPVRWEYPAELGAVWHF